MPMAVAASVIWPSPSHIWVGNIRCERRQKYLQSCDRNTNRAAAENLFVEASFKWEASAPSPYIGNLLAHHLVTNLPRGESVLLPRVMIARARERIASSSSKKFLQYVAAGNGANLTCTSCMISGNVECVEWQEGKLEFTFTPRPEFRLWELPQFHRLYYFPPRNWRMLRCSLLCQVGQGSACLMGGGMQCSVQRAPDSRLLSWLPVTPTSATSSLPVSQLILGRHKYVQKCSNLIQLAQYLWVYSTHPNIYNRSTTGPNCSCR